MDAKLGVSAAEVAALRDAIEAGSARRDEVKEPDFDALRKREGFQKLVAELETKQKAPGAADANGFLCREARQRGDVKAMDA